MIYYNEQLKIGDVHHKLVVYQRLISLNRALTFGYPEISVIRTSTWEYSQLSLERMTADNQCFYGGFYKCWSRKMDGLKGKILWTWMIWGYLHFQETSI